MKNIILSDTDFKQIIAKLYIDGSLRLVQRWKKQRCQLQIFYLEPNQMKILIANLNYIDVKKIFHDISKKPIFICSEQTITFKGKRFDGIPKCEYVKISWEDWNRLHDAIQKLHLINKKE